MMTRLRPLASLAGALTAALALAAALAPASHAQTKTYGKQWAYNNTFGGGNFNPVFGNNAYPTMSISYNEPGGSLYGYPACCLGWHYGFNPTNDTSELPQQVSNIASAPTSFSYTSYGSNMKGDFAYDMFFRSDSAKSTPQLEVMVWGGNDSYPIGTRTASNVLSAGGVTFDLWEGNNNSAGYYVYTFCPHNTGGGSSLPASGSLNVDQKVFFNWLAANRGAHFNNSLYLDVIEAGLEVEGGNGGDWIGANMSVVTGGSGGGTGGGGGGGPVANGTYRITSRADGDLVDTLGQTASGALVGQWPSSGSANQQWTLTYSGGYYTIASRADGSLLDTLGHAGNGTTVGQWPASGSANQQWSLVSAGGGYYKIVNRASGLCLDTGGQTANGSALQQWGSSGSYNQQWSIQ